MVLDLKTLRPDDPFPRILLYMDLLGAKRVISCGTNEEIIRFRELIKTLSTTMQTFQMDCPLKEGVAHLNNLQPEISNFSDHILVSYPVRNLMSPFSDEWTCIFTFCASLLRVSAQFHKYALEQGFLMRGGLTIGSLEHQGSVAWGAGLLKAIEMEKEAIFPRVIIDDRIIELFKKNDPANLQAFRVELDSDGKYFLNYFKHSDFVGMGGTLNQPLLEIYSRIELGFQEASTQNEKVLKKWLWAARHFNNSIDFFCEKKWVNSEKPISKFNSGKLGRSCSKFKKMIKVLKSLIRTGEWYE